MAPPYLLFHHIGVQYVFFWWFNLALQFIIMSRGRKDQHNIDDNVIQESESLSANKPEGKVLKSELETLLNQEGPDRIPREM